MKHLISKNYFVICLLIYSSALAQDVIPGKEGMWPSYISYKTNQPDFSKEKLQITDEKGKTSIVKGLKLQRMEKDELGISHYRYQQEFNNIPVEHAIWVVHEAAGKITSQNGKLIKTFPANLEKSTVISSKAALKKAMEYVGASKYKWEIPAEEEFIKREQGNIDATFYPESKLIYYSGEELNPITLRLAYKLDIYSQEPLNRKYIFVDAINGNILGERELIHETNVNGTALTAYSGTQNIRTDYTGTAYRLRETLRGTGGVSVNTYNLQKTTNYAGAVDFTDADNIWNNINANNDQYATDAHWATEMTYDYYLFRHGRNSIDNAGMTLNTYVHYSSNYFNAFWDGSRMTYGDGDASDGYKPLTSLDVCGHEITHGVTERTSNLAYSYESGAMNEALSDIFGTAVEWYARPLNADWLMGGDFYPIRSMSNPNKYSQPDTYLGSYWYSGSGDNGGVHYNSGVLNYWFYLLTAGGNGTNDHGVAYNVSGIGMAKAARIAYRLNTYYLISTSNYFDARNLGIQAAKDLFGNASIEATQTENAFIAVGLYSQTCGPVLNLATTSVSQYDAHVSWDSLPGSYYYIIQYKADSSSVWIAAGTTTTTSKVINSLSPATLYDWRVIGSCSGVYSEAQLTTVSPTCDLPSNLGATVTGTSVSLEWTPADYNIAYHIYYKQATDSIWINAGWVSTTTYNLTGLNNNTLYDWKIVARCSFDTTDAVFSTFLTDAPSCGVPTGLTAGFSSGLRTIFRWNAVPGAYRYRFQLKWPWSPWNNDGIDEYTTTDSIVYTGFGSGFMFDWRVRAECANNISAYVQSSVSTPCPAPSGLTISGVSANSATLNWIPSGANSSYGYDIYYKPATATNWTYVGATTATFYTVGNLASNVLYNVKVEQSCLNYNSSSVQAQFTTLICGNIAVANATEIRTNTAKITWDALSGTTSYTLQYRKSTTSTWIIVPGIINNYYQLAGLSVSTTYNYQVKANCSLGSGTFSPLASFTTYCKYSGNNSQEFIDYFSLNTINRTSGAEVGGYIHTGLATMLQIGSTGNAGTISAGFSGATKTEIFAVYIDLNRNGIYTDAGERVTGPTTINTTGNVNFTFTVPATASPGATGMRVVMLRSSETMAPCVTGKRGETEDYFVFLSGTGGAFMPSLASTTKGIISSKMSYIVYPNPSEGVYRLERNNSNDITHYEILNLSGAIIEKVNLNNGDEILIDISSHASGIYFLQLSDADENKQVLKLIKK